MNTQTDILESPNLEAVLVDEGQCAERLAHFWREADTHAVYPCATETAVQLLREGGGYDATVELLESWVRDRKVEGVAVRGGRYAWSARAILGTMNMLDLGRRFIPMHPRHVHKLSAAELLDMQAWLAGESTAFNDLAAFDVNMLIEIIAMAHDATMRRVFCTALKAKLRSIDGEILDK